MQTLRGIFPQPKAPPKRDLIKENVKSVKQLEFRNNIAKSDTDLSKLNGWRKMGKSRNCSPARRNVAGKLANNPKNSVKNNQDSEITKLSSNGRKNLHRSRSVQSDDSRPNSVQSRDAFSQTESVDDDYFLKDVIIRLPSASVMDKLTKGADRFKSKSDFNLNLKANECDEDIVKENMNDDPISNIEEVEQLVSEHDIDHKSIAESHSKLGNFFGDSNRTKDNVDNIKHSNGQTDSKNVQQALTDTRIGSRRSQLPMSYRIGEIPKYLQNMKEKIAEKSRLNALIDPHCPSGHVALTDEERLEALDIAQKKYQSLIDEINKMPLTSATLKVKNRQIEIEKELNELDENIRIFSRQKVYVKMI